MKNQLIKKAIFLLGALFLSVAVFSQPPNPSGGASAPLDSSIFLPLTLAVGIIALLAKRKKKNKE